jgi:hypothetical protein
LLGQTISHYRIVEKLGGWASMYKVEDSELGCFPLSAPTDVHQ